MIMRAGRLVWLCLFGATTPGCGTAGDASDPFAQNLGPLVAGPVSSYVTDGAVSTFAVSGNTLFLGGQFSYIGPRTGGFPVVSTSTGTRDAAWPEVHGGAVLAVIADGSGGFYIGGDFTRVGNFNRVGLAHIKSDRTVDSTWAPALNFGGVAYALARS